jgi:hypothetical protein
MTAEVIREFTLGLAGRDAGETESPSPRPGGFAAGDDSDPRSAHRIRYISEKDRHVRVVVADDHPVFREGVVRALPETFRDEILATVPADWSRIVERAPTRASAWGHRICGMPRGRLRVDNHRVDDRRGSACGKDVLDRRPR